MSDCIPESSQIQSIISQSTVLNKGPPTIYKILTQCEFFVKGVIEKRSFGKPFYPPKPTRVLMIVGTTGAGKSTLINGMVNYILGVKWEYSFRFKLICDDGITSESKGCCQSNGSITQLITAYTFYWQEESPFDYNLVIIDTPGFGDIEELKKDKKLSRAIEKIFQMKEKDSLDEIHAIGFVTEASLLQLSQTQNYISDMILSIFGQDIQNNVFIMTTFSVGTKPTVVQEAKIPYVTYFPFNNSALFVDQRKLPFLKSFWEMNYFSFEKFFFNFNKVSGVSLKLSKHILEERKQLEIIIQGVQSQINAGLLKMEEIQQELKIIQEKEIDIHSNTSFVYKVSVAKQRQVIVPQSTSVTTCMSCQFTCHVSCGIENESEKWKCSAMSGRAEDNATCAVCPGRCSWQKHSNGNQIFVMYQLVVTRTSEDLMKKYGNHEAIAGSNFEAMVKNVEEELETIQGVILTNVQRACWCLQRLDVISLRKFVPLSDVDYINLLINSEEQHRRLGWKTRIGHLCEVRMQAEAVLKKPEQNF